MLAFDSTFNPFTPMLPSSHVSAWVQMRLASGRAVRLCGRTTSGCLSVSDTVGNGFQGVTLKVRRDVPWLRESRLGWQSSAGFLTLCQTSQGIRVLIDIHPRILTRCAVKPRSVLRLWRCRLSLIKKLFD